jgi:hypothetical protein
MDIKKQIETPQNLEILSSLSSLKYFDKKLSEDDIVKILSDLKHRVFPRPFERLYIHRERKDLIGAEIGVAGGEHSLSILQTLDVKKLYCIDPYTIYIDYEEGKAHFGVDQASIEDTEKRAHKLLADREEKITWIRKLSSDAINEIRDELDFCYIDGNHEKKFVLEDIKNYYPLVKMGGVIGGHDFYNGYQKSHDDVVEAVIEFAAANKLTLKLELPDWWIIKDRLLSF